MKHNIDDVGVNIDVDLPDLPVDEIKEIVSFTAEKLMYLVGFYMAADTARYLIKRLGE